MPRVLGGPRVVGVFLRARHPCSPLRGRCVREQTWCSFTDASGVALTEQSGVALTDDSGTPRTDASGDALTEESVVPLTDESGAALTGQSGVALTDDSGAPRTDASGDALTEESVVPLTEESGDALRNESGVTLTIGRSCHRWVQGWTCGETANGDFPDSEIGENHTEVGAYHKEGITDGCRGRPAEIPT